MGGHEARDYWDNRGLVRLSTAMFAGPLAWWLSLQIGYALVKWTCSRSQPFVLVLVSLAGLGGALAGAWIGWSCLRQLRADADERGGRLIDSNYLVAVVAIGLNLMLALLIALWAVNPLMVSPCE
jgi:hypothetical protein